MNIAAHKKRPPLHAFERTLVALACVHLGFVPWAFGTMHVWSQCTSLALAVAMFVTALLPRRYTAENSDQGAFVLKGWPRLLRFPLFWLGLALLGYMALQAANPSWIWERNERHWWLRRITDVAWLPTSTDTPFDFFNLWRLFIVYASAWLTVCALWVGITRRRSLQIIFGVLVANALLITIVGIIHRMDGSREILWIREFKGAIGFGSFVYHNHGAAFLALLALCALGLAAWHRFEALRRLARSSPALVWVIAALAIGLGVAYSGSRAGFGLLVGFGLLAIPTFYFARPANVLPSTTPMTVSVMLAAMIIGCMGFVVMKSDLGELTGKFNRLIEQGARDESYGARVLARDRALVMLEKNWVRGTGAGSFRFLFPVYIKDSPVLYEGGRAFWEHAHIDWLQIPIEQGVVGTGLMAAAFGWCFLRWWRGRGWRHPLAVMVMLGCVQTLLHALIDFPFQNPAIVITWWAVLVMALRWLEFESEERLR